MSTANADSSASVSVDVELAVLNHKLRARLSVPLALMQADDLVPVARAITEAVVGAAVEDARANGQEISCRKGCGACCRQLVPITPTEARQIHSLVESLPEPRRLAIRARFAEARKRLSEAGLLDLLLKPEEWPVDRGEELGLKYFFLGVACPFLEDESCSIHPDRPLACREYLVTSRAEECSRPSRDRVHCLKLPLKVSAALARVAEPDQCGQTRPWVPLILAPEWAEMNPDETQPRPGPELFRQFFEYVTGKKLSDPGT